MATPSVSRRHRLTFMGPTERESVCAGEETPPTTVIYLEVIHPKRDGKVFTCVRHSGI